VNKQTRVSFRSYALVHTEYHLTFARRFLGGVFAHIGGGGGRGEGGLRHGEVFG
jgi:hypothetical protein